MTTADGELAASVVRSYCKAWMDGDVMAVIGMYHADLALTWVGNNRFAGTYEGQQASLEALLNLQAATNRVPTQLIDVLVSDHRELGGQEGSKQSVIAIVRERWSRVEGEPESESIDITRALEFTVLDGKLRTCRIFELDQVAIDDWLAA